VSAYGFYVMCGTNLWLWCARISPDPMGQLDVAAQAAGGIRISGWAIDPDTTAPIEVRVYRFDSHGISGTNLGPATTSRPDVGAHFAYAGYGDAHGFDAVVGAGAGPQWVCAYAINAGEGATSLLGCRLLVLDPSPIGHVDTFEPVAGGIHVAGWAIDPETSSPIEVHVSVDGGGTNLGLATTVRPDVGSNFDYEQYGSSHGFDAVVPATTGTHRVCAYGINTGAGANTSLGCTTVTVG
jgi:hypothetical protein